MSRASISVVLVPLAFLACSIETADEGGETSPSESNAHESPPDDGFLASGGETAANPPGAPGTTSSGGTPFAIGGTGGGSTGGVASGSGGASSGGAGSGGTGSGGGPLVIANPSPGCGQSGRPEGGRIYKAGESWLVFPEKYDGAMPLPVLFGFHGCGSYNHGDSSRTTFWDLTRGSGFEDDYVVAIPLAASGSCFDYDTDIVRAKALYDDLVNNHCVDMDRVFGSGYSSGAGFLTSMLTSNHTADFEHFNFRGIAPVAAWQVNHDSQVPTMYIQGVADAERGGSNGDDVVDRFVSVNQCSEQTTPYAVDSCTSAHDGASVDAGCVNYGSCDVETIWCSHDDSAYGGTFHGIPCFYRQAVFDFFESL